MSIITISRDSYSHGSEVAQKLGFRCISRDVLIENQFQAIDHKLNVIAGAIRIFPRILLRGNEINVTVERKLPFLESKLNDLLGFPDNIRVVLILQKDRQDLQL